MKLVLVLQFHEGDRDKAMQLARFIAEIEHAPRTDVEILLASPIGCVPDNETFRLLREKFKVGADTVCHRKGHQKSGWPAGPNGTVEYLFDMGRRWAKPGDYWDGVDGLILIEPDCVPTHAFWLNALKSEWEKALSADKWMMGSWRNSGGPYGHINGNCVINPRIGALINTAGIIGDDLAWDCAIAPYVKDRWFITGAIKNCFQSYDATWDVMIKPEVGDEAPVLVHGFKDNSAYPLARQMVRLSDPAHPWSL